MQSFWKDADKVTLFNELPVNSFFCIDGTKENNMSVFKKTSVLESIYVFCTSKSYIGMRADIGPSTKVVKVDIDMVVTISIP